MLLIFNLFSIKSAEKGFQLISKCLCEKSLCAYPPPHFLSISSQRAKEQNRHNCREFMCLLTGARMRMKRIKIPNAIQIIKSEKLFHFAIVRRKFFINSIAHLITFAADEGGNCSRKITIRADNFFISLMIVFNFSRELLKFELKSFSVSIKNFNELSCDKFH